MPLIELVLSYFLKKGADAALTTGFPIVKRLYSENIVPWWKWSLADTYLSLTGTELQSFYAHEELIDVCLGDQSILLPATMACKPKHDGDLDRQCITLLYSERHFIVPESIYPHIKPVKEKIKKYNKFFNGHVVRFSHLKRDYGNNLILLCPAYYFDSLCTNFAMDHRPKGRGQSLREFLHGKQHKLESFDESQLVNHIGLVCMVESADGMLVFQNRSSEVANRRRTISSSVSGALNKLDVPMALPGKVLTLKDITSGLFRETLGELNVEVNSVRFLGVIREFLRGGKPEFYFFAMSNSSLDGIKSAHIDF